MIYGNFIPGFFFKQAPLRGYDFAGRCAMQVHIIILSALILRPFPAFASGVPNEPGLVIFTLLALCAAAFVAWKLMVYLFVPAAERNKKPALPPVSGGDRRKRNYWLLGLLMLPAAIGASLFLLVTKVLK
jgi:hypothetical protein